LAYRGIFLVTFYLSPPPIVFLMKSLKLCALFGLLLAFPLLSGFHTTETLSSESLQGAWLYTSDDHETVRIIAGRYFAEGTYRREGHTFMAAKGGLWRLEGDELVDEYEFHSADSTKVGKTYKRKVRMEGGNLVFFKKDDQRVWKRLDDGTPGNLHGAWLITGRLKDGEMESVTPGVRKTMKILSGTRFQWIAYNTESKEYLGTGGGSYTSEDGVYTEHIGFFSRDNSRVGAKLNFNFELKDGDWHHSGHSSKGDPLYEVWTKREQIAGQ
jgi:hypothetical protein